MTYITLSLKGRGGFSLIELLAAMVIFCIGLLALFSTFGTTIVTNGYAGERADAVRLAQEQMEAAQGMDFDYVISKNMEVNRNGITYTCQLVATKRQANPYLKDVAITVSWVPRRSSGGAAEQVQLATALIRR